MIMTFKVMSDIHIHIEIIDTYTKFDSHIFIFILFTFTFYITVMKHLTNLKCFNFYIKS